MSSKPWLSVAAALAGGAALVFGLDLALDRWRRRGGPEARAARLRERVHDELAALVSYADAIQVTVDGGLVRVAGYILESEQDGLLLRLKQVPGVHRLHNALSPVADLERLEQLRRGLDETGIVELQTTAYSGA